MKKIKYIAIKEIYHILRDPRSLMIAIAMPIMMTFLYGYAINLDIENTVISIIDYDQTEESREFIGQFYNSTYFTPPEIPPDEEDPEQILRTSQADAVLIIRNGFGAAVTKQQPFSLGMIIDGSDNTLAAAVRAYSDALLNEYLKDQLSKNIDLPQIKLSVQVLYNPDLKSAHFFVPGLIAIILMMISALLTSVTIAREKETGTMEQLMTAPIKPYQLLAGKILPYIILAFLDGLLVLMFALILFGVPFVGSKLLLLLFGFIFIATSLSVGVLISALVETQQVALMLALVTTLLPSVMLSGFIFDIKNMPIFLQLLSNVVAAKFFNVVIRGIMLKGAGLEILWIQGLYLVILMIALMFIANKKFMSRMI